MLKSAGLVKYCRRSALGASKGLNWWTALARGTALKSVRVVTRLALGVTMGTFWKRDFVRPVGGTVGSARKVRRIAWSALKGLCLLMGSASRLALLDALSARIRARLAFLATFFMMGNVAIVIIFVRLARRLLHFVLLAGRGLC